MMVNGQEIIPANPSALSSWVQSYSSMVDDVRLSFNGIEFDLVNGSNNFVVEWYYSNQNLGGESYAFYNDNEGYCEDGRCYHPK